MTIYLRRLWKTTKVKELLNIRVNEHSKHNNYFVSPLAWRLMRNSLPFLNGFYRTFIITKKVKCFYCKANYFYSVSQQQLQNFNEKFNLSLTGKLPLFLCLAVATEIRTNEWTEMCGSRKYPYHPNRQDLPYAPPSPRDFSKISPQNLPQPVPSGISKIFAHPWKCCDLLLKWTKKYM